MKICDTPWNEFEVFRELELIFYFPFVVYFAFHAMFLEQDARVMHLNGFKLNLVG